MFRSRHVVALAVAVAVTAGASLWSCAQNSLVSVTGINLDSLRNIIRSRVPPAAEFVTDTTYGEDDTFGGFLGIGDTRGLIQPHQNAHAGQLTNLKFLARIRVDRNYRELAASPTTADTVWNYWVAALVPMAGSRRPQWVSVYVAPNDSGHIAVRKLSGVLSPAQHTRAIAKWRHSKTAPWASCSDNMCCCEDSGCKTPVAAHAILMQQ